MFFSFFSEAVYDIRSFLRVIFKYDLLQGNVLSSRVGNMLYFSQQQSALLIKKQVLMGFTGSLIHLALVKKLVEKMVVGGGEAWWTEFHEILNTTATTTNYEISVLKSSISVENWL